MVINIEKKGHGEDPNLTLRLTTTEQYRMVHLRKLILQSQHT